ncbi:nuclear transcription factor Y subunit C-9-like protein [Trifolium pratense]|uniref:Nuclear transcription factor Y subunit C-9-like protein n=1 Tax=Trifolium pratense TaxID=57577 RepID=A0A2K3P4G0_TRIPR|nr:nuclear transcription factor Y subunit C-9-like protein [Trifolium pratense]
MDRQGQNLNPPKGSVGSADRWPFRFITGQPAGAQLGQQHNQNPFVGSISNWPFGYMPFQTNQIMTGAPAPVVTSLGGMQSTGQPAGTQLGQHQLAYQQQQLPGFWAYQMTGAPRSAVTSVGGIQPTGQLVGAQLGQHQLAYQHIQQQQQLQQQLQAFWANQYQEVKKVTNFKKNCLPLARIKKIMKADEDVRMVSDDAPVILAKACEMFISELTMRSRNHSKTRTLQKNDIAAAVAETNTFDFLVDIVPHEKMTDYPPAFQFPRNFSNEGGCQTVNPEGPLLPSETIGNSLPVSPAFQIIEADEDINEENSD